MELCERVVCGFKPKLVRIALMDLGRTPPGDLCPAMEKAFHQANHPGIVDLDSRDPELADCNRERDALKERRVDVHVDRFGLEGGKPVGDGRSVLRTASRFVEGFAKAES